MLIAREGDTTTLGAKGPVKLKNPPAGRPVNPKNLFLHNPSTQPAALAAPLFYKTCGVSRHCNPRGEAPSTLTPQVCPKAP